MRPKAICTIGYEGGTVDAFIRVLKDAGVELVLDIRAAPVSRKKGFSKNQLAAHLTEAGIGYRHLRGLGTPKSGPRRRAPDASKASSASSSPIWTSRKLCSISARRSRSRKLSRFASCVLSATPSTATA
jgi:uncharacterized protein (DUF488 family)